MIEMKKYLLELLETLLLCSSSAWHYHEHSEPTHCVSFPCSVQKNEGGKAMTRSRIATTRLPLETVKEKASAVFAEILKLQHIDVLKRGFLLST